MASIVGTGGFGVEYNITDGEPREVFIDGRVIYRTPAEAARNTRPEDQVPVEVDGWQQKLAEKMQALGLHKPSPRYGGYPAVAFWLEERDLLTLQRAP